MFSLLINWLGDIFRFKHTRAYLVVLASALRILAVRPRAILVDGALIGYVDLLVSFPAHLFDLLANQLHPEEALIVLEDLPVAVFLVHVHAVLAVLDQDLQALHGDLQEKDERLVLPGLHLGQDGRDHQPDEDDREDGHQGKREGRDYVLVRMLFGLIRVIMRVVDGGTSEGSQDILHNEVDGFLQIR
jgi:hypothetical protein